MAVTYFGLEAETGGEGNILAGYATYNALEGSGNQLTCPGSDSQSVLSLGALVKRGYGGTQPYLRLAIYLTDGTFVMQGSSALEVTQYDTVAWLSHTSFVDAAGNSIASPTLTGGTDYILTATGMGTGGVYIYQVDGPSNSMYYKVVDYTTGWPSPLGSGWTASYKLNSIRCGVEPALGNPYYAYAQQ